MIKQILLTLAMFSVLVTSVSATYECYTNTIVDSNLGWLFFCLFIINLLFAIFNTIDNTIEQFSDKKQE